MVRQLLTEYIITVNGEGAADGLARACVFILAALLTLSVLPAIIFACAEGASKGKTSSADDSNLYGAGCTAGCGGGCGAAHCTARCVARHPILHGSLMQQQANDNGQQTQNKQALHANSITLLQNLEFLNAAEQDVAVGLAAFILHRLSSYRRNLLSIFTIVTRIMQKPLLHSHGR
ncbi:hypothetical protein WN943_014358 [Citrus x changshan-huyou]